jgi:hypothetical protein
LGCLAACAAACLVEDGFVIGVRAWGAVDITACEGRKGAGGEWGPNWAVMGGLLWKVMYVDLEPARR